MAIFNSYFDITRPGTQLLALTGMACPSQPYRKVSTTGGPWCCSFPTWPAASPRRWWWKNWAQWPSPSACPSIWAAAISMRCTLDLQRLLVRENIEEVWNFDVLGAENMEKTVGDSWIDSVGAWWDFFLQLIEAAHVTLMTLNPPCLQQT